MFQGSDTDAMRKAGQEFAEGARTTDEIIMAVKILIAILLAASWFTGGASATYAMQLQTKVLPWLQKISAALHMFAQVLGGQADAQDQVSAGETVDWSTVPTYISPFTPGSTNPFLPTTGGANQPVATGTFTGGGGTSGGGGASGSWDSPTTGTTTTGLGMPGSTSTSGLGSGAGLGTGTLSGGASLSGGALSGGALSGGALSGGGSGSTGSLGAGSLDSGLGSAGSGGGGSTGTGSLDSGLGSGGAAGGTTATGGASPTTFRTDTTPGGTATTGTSTGGGLSGITGSAGAFGAAGAAGALGLGGAAALASRGKAGDFTSPDGFDYTRVKGVTGNKNVTPEFLRKVEGIATKLGTKPEYLMAAMSFESGGTFSASVPNAAGSGATGLIQFMPKTAVGMGTSTAALARMTPVQQLDYVEKYFAGREGKVGTIERLYSNVLYGHPESNPDKVFFTKGTKAYTQNAGLDADKNGQITLQEAAAVVRNRIAPAR